MMKLLKMAIAAVALGASACATGAAGSSYVQISDPEQLFAAADWTSDVDAAVKAAGWGDRADEIRAHMNEKSGWPAKLASEDSRWFGKDQVKVYKTQQVARLSFYDQPAVILYVPAAANQHMPEGWKPTEDFFLVIGADGVPAPG